MHCLQRQHLYAAIAKRWVPFATCHYILRFYIVRSQLQIIHLPSSISSLSKMYCQYIRCNCDISAILIKHGAVSERRPMDVTSNIHCKMEYQSPQLCSNFIFLVFHCWLLQSAYFWSLYCCDVIPNAVESWWVNSNYSRMEEACVETQQSRVLLDNFHFTRAPAFQNQHSPFTVDQEGK